MYDCGPAMRGGRDSEVDLFAIVGTDFGPDALERVKYTYKIMLHWVGKSRVYIYG